jgi:hypothetical protein
LVQNGTSGTTDGKKPCEANGHLYHMGSKPPGQSRQFGSRLSNDRQLGAFRKQATKHWNQLHLAPAQTWPGEVVDYDYWNTQEPVSHRRRPV